MIVNSSIFKSYDIRGIYPRELDAETAYQVGQIFSEYIGAKGVVIGRDMRLSSPALFKGLTKGIIDGGKDVYNIGEAPTECLYFATGFYEYDGGIMITASHNPKSYNGFKMIKRETDWIEVIRGKEVGKMIKDRVFTAKPGKKGALKDIDIWQDYLKHIFSFIDKHKVKPFRVVVDTANGMAGKVVPQLKNELPIKIISLNSKLDGSFPAHSPNPLFEGATDQISRVVKKEKADFGFIFDGDADRIFLIDEGGELIRGDITLLLLARHLLAKNLTKGIAYNVICSKAVPEFIRKWGGNPIKTPVGFVNVRKGMLENDGIMGGEVSGHYCFKENFYFDSGFIAFLILLQIISEDGRKVSEITAELSPYAKSPEINFEIENKEEVLKKIREKYSDGKQDYLDGVTVEYDNWWFNLRPSQTEPLLRLTIEANTEELLEEKKKELTALIRGEE